MRKGEKLIKYLSEKFPVLDRYEVQARDARLVKIIMNMTDEEFDKITKNITDMSKNEVACTLCNVIVHHFPKRPETQEELDRFICSECEEKVEYWW